MNDRGSVYAVLVLMVGLFGMLILVTYVGYPLLIKLNETFTEQNLYTTETRELFMRGFYILPAAVLTLAVFLFIWVVAYFMRRETFERYRRYR